MNTEACSQIDGAWLRKALRLWPWVREIDHGEVSEATKGVEIPRRIIASEIGSIF